MVGATDYISKGTSSQQEVKPPPPTRSRKTSMASSPSRGASSRADPTITRPAKTVEVAFAAADDITVADAEHEPRAYCAGDAARRVR